MGSRSILPISSSSSSGTSRNVLDSSLPVLARICQALKEIFFKGYGDPKQSFCKDQPLPALTGWQYVANLPSVSRLVIQNTDAANELMVTFNNDDSVGYRIKAGTNIVFDDMKGQLYAKSSDSTKTSSLNLAVFALYTEE